MGGFEDFRATICRKLRLFKFLSMQSDNIFWSSKLKVVLKKTKKQSYHKVNLPGVVSIISHEFAKVSWNYSNLDSRVLLVHVELKAVVQRPLWTLETAVEKNSLTTSDIKWSGKHGNVNIYKSIFWWRPWHVILWNGCFLND